MPPRKRSRQTISAERLAQSGITLSDVSEVDFQRTLSLSSWLFKYVNFIHENGGAGGNSLKKGFSDAVGWQKLRPTFNDDALDITAYARRRDLDWPGIRSTELEDYLRQMRDGFEFSLDMNRYVNKTDPRSTAEHVELEIDADGKIVKGSYRWFGPDESLRTTPNADFNSPEAAHKALVTGRLAATLTTFVELVSDPQSGIWLVNTYNPALTYLVPDDLRI